jgi:hypothetical protein
MIGWCFKLQFLKSQSLLFLFFDGGNHDPLLPLQPYQPHLQGLVVFHSMHFYELPTPLQLLTHNAICRNDCRLRTAV